MNLKIIAPGLIALLCTMGCQKPGGLFPETIHAEITATLPLTLSPGGQNGSSGTFSTTIHFDPLENEDLSPYRADIKSFKISGVTVRISELVTDVTLTDIRLVIMATSGSVEWTFSRLPLTNGMVIPFDNTGQQWARLEALLMDKGEVTVTLSGQSNLSGPEFNIELKIVTTAST